MSAILRMARTVTTRYRRPIAQSVYAILAFTAISLAYLVRFDFRIPEDYLGTLKFVVPIGKLFGLTVKIFTMKELKDGLTDAGFEIDYQWQTGKGKVAFMVAKKAG